MKQPSNSNVAATKLYGRLKKGTRQVLYIFHKCSDLYHKMFKPYSTKVRKVE